MKFTTVTTFVYPLLSFLSLAVFAAPLELRDVYVPRILYPTEGIVWKVGEHHHVTWDTSNPPVNITNKVGEVRLRKGGLTSSKALADNFNILLGKIEIIVPQVKDGDDYQIVLFGDSGNFSPKFTIKNY